MTCAPYRAIPSCLVMAARQLVLGFLRRAAVVWGRSMGMTLHAWLCCPAHRHHAMQWDLRRRSSASWRLRRPLSRHWHWQEAMSQPPAPLADRFGISSIGGLDLGAYLQFCIHSFFINCIHYCTSVLLGQCWLYTIEVLHIFKEMMQMMATIRETC